MKSAQTACEPIQFVNIWDSNGGGNYTFIGNGATKPLEAAARSRYFGAQSNGTLKVVFPAITGYVATIDTTPPTILAVSSNVTQVSH